MTDFDRQVAAEIRAIKGRERHSGRWLARQTGLTPGYVEERLREERPFTAGDVARIAEALQVPTHELIRRAANAA